MKDCEGDKQITEKEILAMEAGIELDCLITKEFFPGGYHEYSTNILAAWQVVERLYDEGIFLRMLSNRQGKYFCSFGGKHLAYSAIDAESAPVAICKAALLAKMRTS